MDSEDLEIVLKEKVKPLIDSETQKNLGVNIDQLSEDITSKLNKSTLIDIEIDIALPYKNSKKKFKRAFLTKLLLLHLGNISEVARVSGTNRRSIHRLIKVFHINVKKIKKELIRPYDMKINTLNNLIGHVLNDYKTIIHPQRLKKMYISVSNLSENILKELPEPKMTFTQAQKNFELRFFKQVLKDNNNNITKTAKKIGLRYETLQRKLKAIDML